ncbi:MAG: Rieske 2Fe-2S domain-containing protein [Alphaproteobacteria bacterium]
MQRYRADPGAIAALFQQNRVHRDAYVSDEIFQLERERLFAPAWVFAGHESQVPATGDYATVEILGVPLVLVRKADGSVVVLANRCAHRGAMIFSDARGNTGRALRCPYHGWTYRLDGSLLGVPMRGGYDEKSLEACGTNGGLHRMNSTGHRGFVFVQLDSAGPSFQDYFGASLSFIDMMADRSPDGELEVAGECLRSRIRCNWKIYLENINDGVHVHAAHESAAIGARKAWSSKPADEPKPMAIEQLWPFQFNNEFMDAMGGRVLRNGHSVLGTRSSIHSGYGEIPGYATAMNQAYGSEKAAAILSFSPQNMVLYPSIALKTSPQTMRVLRPLAPDSTIVESWAFRPKGTPDILVERSMTYNRIAFSPMSLVAHDDIHVFETVQHALSNGHEDWVSFHRGYKADEAPGDKAGDDVATNGTNEILMRNQYRAWVKYMTGAAETRT